MILLCITLSLPAAQMALARENESNNNQRKMAVHELYSKKHEFQDKLNDTILAGTPIELGERWSEKPTRTVVAFDVDKTGKFSNWRLTVLSGSIARDFWTLYSAFTCPEVLPPTTLTFPFPANISNIKIQSVRGVDAQTSRIELADCISRKIDAKYVYFPLIPATFAKAYPDKFNISEITSKENLVGIATERLWKSSPETGGETANQTIRKDKQLQEFLLEWSNFLKAGSVQKVDIQKFASSLRSKYKSLLKEGEPVAPLP